MDCAKYASRNLRLLGQWERSGNKPQNAARGKKCVKHGNTAQPDEQSNAAGVLTSPVTNEGRPKFMLY